MINILRMACLCLSLLAVVAHAKTELTRGDPRIIGGERTTSGDWPSTVALFASENDGIPFCAGALIAPRWVLTAAHCAKGENPANIFVVLGTTDLTDEDARKEIEVKRIIVSPEYDEAIFDNDIALIELKKIADITTIPLFTGNATDNMPATVVGWGTRNVNPVTGQGFNPSQQLYELSLPIVSQKQCRRIMEDVHNMGPITTNMICAGKGEGGEDTCQGDSGGPLMVRQNNEIRLIGLVSWGVGCADANTYGVYTRVSNFSKWIKSAMDSKPSEDDNSEAGAIFWILFPLVGILFIYRRSSTQLPLRT